jgi:hypothetical protein
MATISAPSYELVTQAAADSVLGVQGGAVKRFGASPSFGQLGASFGAGLVGFSHAQTYPSGTLGAKAKQVVSVKDAPFNAVGDGITDDTAAIHAAMDYAKSISAEVWFPAGPYRVTSGYTQAVARNNVVLRGCGRINEPSTGSPGALILLDTAGPGSFFMDIAASCTLRCEGLTFKCAQAVTDRDFFRFSGALVGHFFEGCSFEAVERPIVYKAGIYFQNASFRDVQFRNSGTIHSESAALVGSLLRLDNVNHEGAVPANTEKIVCNLQGVRKIAATNFLLEGALPSAGWTVLKLNSPDGVYTRTPYAVFTSCWSEWSGAFAPTYSVNQVSGTVIFDASELNMNGAIKYRLASLAKLVLRHYPFTTNLADPATFFELENAQCVVQFENCLMREFDTTAVGFRHLSSQQASITDGEGQLVLSNDGAEELYRWRGGYVDDGPAALFAFTADVYTPSTDATYGRKLLLGPTAGALNVQIRVPAPAVAAGETIVVMARAKLPTFAVGLWAFRIWSAAVGTVKTKYFDASYSGQVVDVCIAVVLPAAPGTVGATFESGTSMGATGNLELYALSILRGSSIPRNIVAAHPRNVVSYASAAPASSGANLGTSWARGDRVINLSPAVGQPKGWVCTVAGTPGTWVSEGNL